MRRLREWLRANWPALVLGLAVGASVAWLLRPAPQPAVEAREQRTREAHGQSTTDSHASRGPVDVKRKWTLYGPQGAPRLPTLPGGSPSAPAKPGAAPCPVVAVLEEEEHRGPEATDVHATEQHEAKSDERRELKLTPSIPPAWSLQVGVEDLLGSRDLRVAVRYRLGGFGPCVNLWAEGSVKPRIDRPLDSTVGAALACDVH